MHIAQQTKDIPVTQSSTIFSVLYCKNDGSFTECVPRVSLCVDSQLPESMKDFFGL